MRYSVIEGGEVVNIIELDPDIAGTWAKAAGVTVRPWEEGDDLPPSPAPEYPAADTLEALADEAVTVDGANALRAIAQLVRDGAL